MKPEQEKSIIPEALKVSTPAVVILSGGMDSAVLLAWLNSRNIQVMTLSFDYGSRHNARELPMASVLAKFFGCEHRQVKLDFFSELYHSALLQNGPQIPDGHYADDNMRQTVVPFRNGIFLAVAIGVAEELKYPHVMLGSHAGDHTIYPDCRPEFTAAISQAAILGTYAGVQVLSPFSRMDKRDIGDLGRGLGLDFRMTWTCYKGQESHCGVCGACTERKYALRYEEGLDPTHYLA